MLDKQKPLTGKTIIVTGATAGIGKATALEFAHQGAGVVLVSRNPKKCAAIAKSIQTQTGNPKIDYLSADLSSQSQIRRLAERFISQYDRLDVLVNNAGAVYLNRQLSVDGIEKTLALNHLSYFLLTHFLLDVLEASAPARVVNVSSNAHFGAELDYDDLQLEHSYAPFKAYGQSKFTNVLFTYELARRLDGKEITSNVLHPGLVKTDIAKSASWWAGWAWSLVTLFRMGLTPEDGARTSVYLASSPEVEGLTGKYFAKQKAVPSDPATYDQTAARRLWEISLQMVGLKEG